MAQRGRLGLSNSQRADLWERWKSGQSLNDIARALGKFPGSIRGVVSSEGGIAPHIRRRSPLALRLSEREEISRGIAMAASLRSTPARLLLHCGEWCGGLLEQAQSSSTLRDT